jgi:hypothetical protein
MVSSVLANPSWVVISAGSEHASHFQRRPALPLQRGDTDRLLVICVDSAMRCYRYSTPLMAPSAACILGPLFFRSVAACPT